ncbi:MAG TPA: hypothetical protein P5268_07540 [Candidatus Marinimicrobia bacterium]|nr:hypothetical protein [Candidatus Neomarinimicrobiota bacterium]HRS52225.1 hypothetical protein [Candidatus Neomarinimicrobiota bacterium]HRU92867.1 hypothetical protein [Candidatus Neomarinimicrobiota bacterium]
MMKILPRRFQRKSRVLIVGGLILLTVSLICLYLLVQQVNGGSKNFPTIYLRILCVLDLIIILAGGIILFWGISIWFRNQIFKG